MMGMIGCSAAESTRYGISAETATSPPPRDNGPPAGLAWSTSFAGLPHGVLPGLRHPTYVTVRRDSSGPHRD